MILSDTPDPLNISPATPTQSWDASRALFPSESVQLQVNVDSTGTVGDKEYVFKNTTINANGQDALWVTKAGAPGSTSFTFEVVNSAQTPQRYSVEVKATWSTEVSSGGGGASVEELPGSAIGTAYTEIPVFLWYYESRLEFADGQTPIHFRATADANGATIPLNDYTIHGEPNWDIANQAGTANSISGTVKSDTAGKGKLKVYYNGNEIDESEDEIAFAKVDLAIASVGSAANLPDDKKPDGTPATPAHDMDPGGIVIANIEGSTATPMRTKLTLTAPSNNPGTDIKYILSKQNLDKAKIFGSATGTDEITLEKEYTAGEFGSSKTLYIESKPFEPTDPPSQTGTLKLEYQCQINGNTGKLEDVVKVTLLPVKVKVYRPQEVQKAVSWNIPREDRVIPQSEIDQRGVGIRVNGDGNDGGNENDLIELEFNIDIPDGMKLVVKRASNNVKVYGEKNATSAILTSGNESVVNQSMLPPRSYWIEATDRQALANITFAIRSSGGGNATDIAVIPFRTFTTVVTALSGETGFGGDPLTHGTYDISLDLYKKGYNIHYYAEKNEARCIAEMSDQGTKCKVIDAAVFGYSHGGGSTYRVAKEAPGGLNLKYTGYIDAVTNRWQFTYESEERRPPGSAYHFNYYQTNGVLNGEPSVPAADLEKDLTATTDHGTIHNDPSVIKDLTDSLETKIDP